MSNPQNKRLDVNKRYSPKAKFTMSEPFEVGEFYSAGGKRLDPKVLENRKPSLPLRLLKKASKNG